MRKLLKLKLELDILEIKAQLWKLKYHSLFFSPLISIFSFLALGVCERIYINWYQSLGYSLVAVASQA